ncbi:hypothetical protein O0Q50_19325 [Priestia aryabhattai]|uniref:HNH endonuclease n=1 Tax=Priestia aryabhattai TaxID=412384 RepID=A0AAX6NC66_PRIAR|nr:hypothetical protein [Priestia aryabhattai]MDU9693326.1 hypothetical protein [Priestia aryabhattai]
MPKKKTKLEMFEYIYSKEIKTGSWITKDEMAENGFFPKNNTNGRDIRFIKRKYDLEIITVGTREARFRIVGTKAMLLRRPISKKIKDFFTNKRCVLTGTRSSIEVDHKNGRYNDKRVLSTKTQTVNDFQPLTKVANNIKREHCRKCAATNKKFDAKELGYLVSTLDGNLVHNNKSSGCEGCFFYDVTGFKEDYNTVLSTCFGTNNPFTEEGFHEYYKKLSKRNSSGP